MENQLENVTLGISYGTFSGFIVYQLSLNTIGIYSLTLILYEKVFFSFFATITFQYLSLQWKISYKMHRDLL